MDMRAMASCSPLWDGVLIGGKIVIRLGGGEGLDGCVGLGREAGAGALMVGATLGVRLEAARSMPGMLAADPEGPQGMRPHSGTGCVGSGSAGGQMPGACA